MTECQPNAKPLAAESIGADADLIAVAGDPLRDIRAVHHMAAVYREGRQVVERQPAKMSTTG